MKVLSKVNEGRDRRSNVVILRFFNFRWEGDEVGRWERWEGGEGVRCERRESGGVGGWEVPGFLEG